jgi:hypothetical protein
MVVSGAICQGARSGNAMTEGGGSPWMIPAITGGFLVIFPIVWCGVVLLLSVISGWRRLARDYAAGDRKVTGQARSGVIGMVGMISYRFVLTVHVNKEGFFMEVLAPFRIGQPRLFIPWDAVSSHKRYWSPWWKAETMKIGNPPIAAITLPLRALEGSPLK